MYRIFLVEDDETIAKLVRRHLEKWDYDVHVVQKFDAVMSEFASFDPHLVLMDIGLPFYNGYHWCTEIRRVSKVPVVFLSSAADNMNIIHFLRREMLDFTAFPVFFVSNLLLVQRKKYYFNRAMVSRNCSIVL